MKKHHWLVLLFMSFTMLVGYVYLFHWGGERELEKVAQKTAPEMRMDEIITTHGYVDVLAMASKKLQQQKTYHPMIDPYIDEPRKRVTMDPFDEYVSEVHDEYDRVPESVPESEFTYDLRVDGKWPVYHMSLKQLKKEGEIFDLEAWAMNPQRVEKSTEDIRVSFFTYLMKLQGLEKTSVTTKFIGGFGAKINADINPYFRVFYMLENKRDHKRFMDILLHQMIQLDRLIKHPDYTLRTGAFYSAETLMGSVARNKFLTQRQRAALTYALGEWMVVPNLWNARPQRMFGPHKDDILISLMAAYHKAGVPSIKFRMFYRDRLIKERLRKHLFRDANFHRLVGAEYLLSINKPLEAEAYLKDYDLNHEFDKERRLDILSEINKLKQQNK